MTKAERLDRAYHWLYRIGQTCGISGVALMVASMFIDDPLLHGVAWGLLIVQWVSFPVWQWVRRAWCRAKEAETEALLEAFKREFPNRRSSDG